MNLQDLKTKAQKLLESNTVNVIIGYGQGSGGEVRPVFIRKPADIDKLVLNDKCVQNLAVYLTKHEIKKLGKPGIVAPLPVTRAIYQLMLEKQIADGEIVVLSIKNNGIITELTDNKSIRSFISDVPSGLTSEEKARLSEIKSLSQQDKWRYWDGELSACIKCYACKSSCPLCYCSRCTIECNQPQWISVPSHQLGNMEWHIMRAMHLAGRCVNCGECARACPMGIPLNLLTQRLFEVIEKTFGTSESADAFYPLSTFNVNDKEDFIR
jgi:ferredoxin